MWVAFRIKPISVEAKTLYYIISYGVPFRIEPYSNITETLYDTISDYGFPFRTESHWIVAGTISDCRIPFRNRPHLNVTESLYNTISGFHFESVHIQMQQNCYIIRFQSSISNQTTFCRSTDIIWYDAGIAVPLYYKTRDYEAWSGFKNRCKYNKSNCIKHITQFRSNGRFSFCIFMFHFLLPVLIYRADHRSMFREFWLMNREWFLSKLSKIKERKRRLMLPGFWKLWVEFTTVIKNRSNIDSATLS